MRKTPEKACVRFAGETITYAQAQQRSRQAALALAGLGVKRGDRVALMCYNTPGFIDAMLGAWRLGATVVPINHKLQAPEVRYILEHSKSRACIADGALAAVIKPLSDVATCLSTPRPSKALRTSTHCAPPHPRKPLPMK